MAAVRLRGQLGLTAHSPTVCFPRHLDELFRAVHHIISDPLAQPSDHYPLEMTQSHCLSVCFIFLEPTNNNRTCRQDFMPANMRRLYPVVYCAVRCVIDSTNSYLPCGFLDWTLGEFTRWNKSFRNGVCFVPPA